MKPQEICSAILKAGAAIYVGDTGENIYFDPPEFSDQKLLTLVVDNKQSILKYLKQRDEQLAKPPDERDLEPVNETLVELANESESEELQIPPEMQELLLKHGVNLSMPTSSLLKSELKDRYIVDNVLVAMQPATVSGLHKTLKTTVCVDMAVSIASGSPFLGHYKVNSAERVLFLTGEIGIPSAKRLCKAVAASKEVLDQIDNDSIHWQTWVPYIPDPEQLQILKFEIERTESTVVFLDPMYQMLDGNTAANYSLNGQQLKDICKLCIDLGATPICVDHAKKSSENAKIHEPLQLEDISGAGKAEYFRQWILLSRMSNWSPGNPHNLWATIGGSAGHADLIGITIDDSLDAETGQRGYSVEVQGGNEIREQRKQQAKQRKEQDKLQAVERYVAKIISCFVGNRNGLTKSKISTLTGINKANLDFAIAKLLEENRLEICEVEVNKRIFDGFKLTESEHRTPPNSTVQKEMVFDAV